MIGAGGNVGFVSAGCSCAIVGYRGMVGASGFVLSGGIGHGEANLNFSGVECLDFHEAAAHALADVFGDCAN